MNYPAEKIEFCHRPERPVRVGRISYINVAPIYYGLDNGLRPDWLQLENHPPARLNHMMQQGMLDMSLVSSIAYAKNHDSWILVPSISISCSGNAMSVVLASKVPFDQLGGKKILLTDESESAASLLKLLCAAKGVEPIFKKEALPDPEDICNKADAALVIGNAALCKDWGHYFGYVMDLGTLWFEMTGLPFVFAVLAVQKSFAEKFPETVSSVVRLFDISKSDGMKNIDIISRKSATALKLATRFCETYHNTLRYDLCPEKILGLKTFFEHLFRHGLINQRAAVSFFKDA